VGQLKNCVHTLKFQWIWLKFVGNDLEWESATLCKLSYLDPHVGSRREPDPKIESSCSHFKISTNLTEICWRCLRVTVCYFMQIIIPRSTCGLHVKSRTLKLKLSHLKMVVRYFVQITIPRSTRGPHIESRTPKLKARVHTLKFQWFCLKFVGNVLEWQSAILCKLEAGGERQVTSWGSSTMVEVLGWGG
jgi:hypothetical protein